MNCIKTRKGNRRGMCNYAYVENPMQLIANLLRRLHLEGKYQSSIEFSALENKLVIVIGIDKSDSDVVVTVRICNRVKGNSKLHVQALSILEGPVAECWDNHRITIGNLTLPTCEAIQRMLEDSYFCLTFSGEDAGRKFNSTTFFEPNPLTEALKDRVFEVSIADGFLCESRVSFDDCRHEENEDKHQNDEGNPVQISMRLTTKRL